MPLIFAEWDIGPSWANNQFLFYRAWTHSKLPFEASLKLKLHLCDLLRICCIASSTANQQQIHNESTTSSQPCSLLCRPKLVVQQTTNNKSHKWSLSTMYLAVDRQTIDPRLSMHCTLAGPELPLSPQTRQWRGNRGPRGSKHSALKYFFQRETVACFVNFYCLGNFAQVLWAFNRELNRISRQGRSHRPNVFFFLQRAKSEDFR